jgi:hypothetical protein
MSTGGSSGASATNYTQNLVVFRNTMRDHGDWRASTENDAVGVIASQFATNTWIIDNEIFHMGGDSVRIGADQGDQPSGQYYFVGRNHFYDNRENAIDVKQARHATLSQNIMHGFASSSSSGGEAVVIHYDPENIWLIGNTIYNSRRGVVSTGVGPGTYAIGNLVYDCETAFHLDRGGGIWHVYNNTIHRCQNGINTSGVLNSLHYANNIVSEITSSNGYHLYLSGTGIANASSASNFLFYQSVGPVRIHWGGATYTSVGAWTNATGKGHGSLSALPRFIDPNSNNYRLNPNSPAVDAGISLNDLDSLYHDSFGASFLKDLDGITRPQGAAWDLGAYEFTEESFQPRLQIFLINRQMELTIAPATTSQWFLLRSTNLLEWNDWPEASELNSNTFSIPFQSDREFYRAKRR